MKKAITTKRLSLDLSIELYEKIQKAALNNQRKKCQEIRMRLIRSFPNKKSSEKEKNNDYS